MKSEKYYMKCSKCLREFEEPLLQLSHDVPRYIGGTDLDGRHWLCSDCHHKYEWKVFSVCANYISRLSPEIKNNLKKIAKKISGEFFK